MSKILPIQETLRRALPTVHGCKDYREQEALLLKVDQVLRTSGVEQDFLRQSQEIFEAAAARAVGAGKKAKAGARAMQRHMQSSVRALRCTILGRLAGQSYRELSESLAMRPVSPYAASKASADHVALQAHLGFGQSVVRARPFNHLGPGQSNRFVAAALAERVARNELDDESHVRVGNLSPRRDFTDVRDVVRAYRLLVEHGADGEVYNVCSGQAIAVQSLADELIALARIPMELVIDPDLERPVDIPVLLGDNSRLCADTGWTPEIPLTTTLADLLDDQRRRVHTT